jgi:hypothetical protein
MEIRMTMEKDAMTKYRICPYGSDRWKVQRRFLGLFWVNVNEMVGPGYYTFITFDLESEAERWIKGQVAAEHLGNARKLIARERQRSVVPRPFP